LSGAIPFSSRELLPGGWWSFLRPVDYTTLSRIPVPVRQV
jgi:hypothetical protein